MVTQNFVGDKPVDKFPQETIQKIPDEELTKQEFERLSKGANKEPGANKRAGIATRDPAQFDTGRRGGLGGHLPTKEPVV